MKTLLENIRKLKTDERKVSVFGSGMDSWEARTYDEKQLVNAVLREVEEIIIHTYSNETKKEGAKEVTGWIRGKFMNYPDIEYVDDQIGEALAEYLEKK